MAESFQSFEPAAAELGLELNIGKCEIVCPESDPVPEIFAGFRRVRPSDCELLGAPLLGGDALSAALSGRCSDLNRAMSRLAALTSHDALLILKHSLSAPKLLYILRCSPCTGHHGLDEFDRLLRVTLSAITNLVIDDLGWVQAGLPVAMGGLGVRSVGLLAPSAFLASAAATLELQNSLLPADWAGLDTHREEVFSVWSERYSAQAPVGNARYSQKAWDQPCVQCGVDILTSGHTDAYHKARILAVGSRHSGDWLHAWPISACGLRLDDEAIRVAVGLRLGVGLCIPHQCPCGSPVDARGNHGLSCRRSAGRQTRHAQLNDAVHRALVRAGVPAKKEPTGLMRSGDRRPDGCTLIGWESGRNLAWDVTVPDTLAASHLADTSRAAGAAAEAAARLKTDKYSELRPGIMFCPIAIETLGPINGEGDSFLAKLGHRLSEATGDLRAGAFLYQRLSIIIQRCNAICMAGTFEIFWPAD